MSTVNSSLTNHWVKTRPWKSAGTISFCLIWAFIVLATAYDMYFAWKYRAVLDAWEMNPFILWLAGMVGLGGVFVFKLFATLFSTALAGYCHYRRHPMKLPLTLIIGCAYFVLSFHYLLAQMQD